MNELAELAKTSPELRGEIFQHPNASPPFKQWLASLPAVPPSPSGGRGGGLKGFMLGLLAGILVMVLLGVGAVTTGMLRLGEPRIEGRGFDTPEAAALAYLEALGELDTAAMVSSFAIESYAENCDFVALAEWRQFFSPADPGCVFPPDSGGSLAVSLRHSQVQQRAVVMVLSSFVSPNLWNDASGTRFEDEGDIIEFQQGVEDNLARFRDSGISDITQIEPADVIDNYPRVLELDRSPEVLGVAESDVEFLLYSFTSDGEEYFFGPTAVSYEGRWFLAEMTSPASMGLGIPAIGIGQPG